MFEITIVIPTYNRPEQVKRSIDSVIRQRTPHHSIEIIVVNDASTVEYDLTTYIDGQTLYHIMPVNGGPNPCRMFGIEHASKPWILLLDDDDILLEGAIEYLATILHNRPFTTKTYPVYQFSTGQHTAASEFTLVSLDQFFDGTVQGDHTMVLHKKTFLEFGFRYPNNKAGGEHLLWWDVAQKAQIPTFKYNLVQVLEDAISRLTDAQSQIKNAKNHQALALSTLEAFGSYLQEKQPARYLLTRSGLVVYSLLANEKEVARNYLSRLELPQKLSRLLWWISFLPTPMIHILFRCYRWQQKRKLRIERTPLSQAQSGVL